ncbi:unnamed protein product, partial [Meganyctiphanes norvegica]
GGLGKSASVVSVPILGIVSGTSTTGNNQFNAAGFRGFNNQAGFHNNQAGFGGNQVGFLTNQGLVLNNNQVGFHNNQAGFRGNQVGFGNNFVASNQFPSGNFGNSQGLSFIHRPQNFGGSNFRGTSSGHSGLYTAPAQG